MAQGAMAKAHPFGIAPWYSAPREGTLTTSHGLGSEVRMNIDRRGIRTPGRSPEIALMVVTALSAGSCERFGKSCTEIGCGADLAINVQSERWPPGSYVVQISSDEADFECRFEQGGSAGTAGAAGAPADAPVVVGVDSPRGTSTTGVPLGDRPPPPCVRTSGATTSSVELFLEEAAHISIYGTNPSEVTVIVIHDEEQVHDEDLKPAYTRSFPNGRDCDDGCLQATEDVTLTTL